MKLNPSTVLITGANRGHGLEFVKQFLSLPSAPKLLFATCRDFHTCLNLQELIPHNPNLKVIKLDVDDEMSIKDAFKTVEGYLQGHGLNLLINNAGVLEEGGISDTTGDSMMRLFRTNAVGPFLVAQTFLPALNRAAKLNPSTGMSCNKAAIVNISSVVACFDQNYNGSLYAYRCSKAALNMITKTLSVDLKDNLVLSVSLDPGWVQTDMAPMAHTLPRDRVHDMIKVMGVMNESSNGLFFHAEGFLIPW
ncbi:C-factor-like [Gigantopelta aegis]|uniref:C-factor-like n=1 Tax=Gigantopelta aegis TaxID=1735272 RepID=UPI001B88B9F0|nr:C-factor-like [Gigantopelta aegis]